jgi:hypothetical protein
MTTLATNVNMKDARPYVARVRGATSGFVSTTLFDGALEYSCFTGATT